MKIGYDAQVDALSITFRETTLTTKHLAAGIAADYDSEGRLAGLEILDAQERLRLGAAAGKTVRAGVIAALPADDLAGLAGDALAQFAGEPVGNVTVFHLGLEQIGFEAGAENSFHAGVPKTCSKFKPASLPDSKSSKRRLSSDLISASERQSFSRL